MIYFIDFDFTIADTLILKNAVGNYKDKQKLIPQITIYKEAIEILNTEDCYIVSGNVGSTIKKAIKHFNLPISEDRVVGYRQGMPMQNLQRKIAVIKEAIKKFKLEDKLNEIVYLGDEEDDKTASEITGIKFRLADWGDK